MFNGEMEPHSANVDGDHGYIFGDSANHTLPAQASRFVQACIFQPRFRFGFGLDFIRSAIDPGLELWR
jgi:hypothetical protein